MGRCFVGQTLSNFRKKAQLKRIVDVVKPKQVLPLTTTKMFLIYHLRNMVITNAW